MKPYPDLFDVEIGALKKGECPDCGSHEFLAGPRGGMCQNFKCAQCGACFNIGPQVWFAERISEPGKKFEGLP